MSFEDRLWDRLEANNAEQLEAMRHEPSRFAVNRPRRPSLPVALGGGLAAAAMAGAAVFGLGLWEAPPAFAVAVNADGTVAITLREVSAIAALNKKLAADGIQAKAIPVRAGCANRHRRIFKFYCQPKPAKPRSSPLSTRRRFPKATAKSSASSGCLRADSRCSSGHLPSRWPTACPPIPTGPRAPTGTSGASS